MATHNANNERIKRRYFVLSEGSQAPQRGDGGRGRQGFGAVRGRHQVPGLQGVPLRAGHRLQEAPGRAETARRPGSKLSKATLNATLAHLKRFFQWLAGQAGLQVAASVFRRRLFQPVGKGRARCDGAARTGRADPGAGEARHRADAGRDRDRAPKPRAGRLHAADRRAGQRHRLDEAEACRPAGGLRLPGRSRGSDQVQQDLHDLLLPGRRGDSPDRRGLGDLSAGGEALGQ